MGQPKFAVPRGLARAADVVPPFDFDGVTMRVFPLRADLRTVQRFLDRYLNIVPLEVASFRAFSPYVYLCVLNYGRMNVCERNLGWISQREIALSVPMEWHVLDADTGKLAFHDWAVVSPFIYVDHETSMRTGREVYGWPKYLVSLEGDASSWLEDPRQPPDLARVSTMVFPEMYAGRRQEPRVFLEIRKQRSTATSALRQLLSSPWDALSRAWSGAGALWSDSARCFAHFSGASSDMKSRARRLLSSSTSAVVNTVNLKQFRSSRDPRHACYQAITNARMTITARKAWGPLGLADIVAGDSSGGFRVLMHRYDALPMIESLGIEVANEHANAHANVAELVPVLPFWVEADLHYDLGRALAWRVAWDPRWHVDAPAARTFPARDLASGSAEPTYNTTRGAATQELGGPFRFPDTTLRVLPLLADPVKLRELVDDILTRPLAGSGNVIEPWGRCVYLVVSNHERMTSATNDVGLWAERDLSFLLPVLWWKVDDAAGGARRLVGGAVVPVFSFTDSSTAAITGSEVSGIPTQKASFETPPAAWLSSDGPRGSLGQALLRVSMSSLPALGEGQRSRMRPLLEIRELPDVADDGADSDSEWQRALHAEQARLTRAHNDEQQASAARALALEVLALRRPVRVLTLKQFRDCERPAVACYQSLVRLERTIESVESIEEMTRPIEVRVHESASLPLCDVLGLVSARSCDDDGARVRVLAPLRPFWLRVSLMEDLGSGVCGRAGDDEWQAPPAAAAGAGDDDGTAARVSPELLAAIEREAPVSLGARIAQASESDGEQAPFALASTEPQAVVSSLLSREWEHRGTGARWRREHARLTQLLASVARDAADAAAGSAELAFIEGQVRAVERSGRPYLVDELRLRALPRLRAAVAAGAGSREQQREHRAALEDVVMLLAKCAQRHDIDLGARVIQQQRRTNGVVEQQREERRP